MTPARSADAPAAADPLPALRLPAGVGDGDLPAVP
jgi:hypothetical protein